MGSALSPNGLGFSDGGADEGGNMVSCSLMDKVVEVDRVSGRARVQVRGEVGRRPACSPAESVAQAHTVVLGRG